MAGTLASLIVKDVTNVIAFGIYLLSVVFFHPQTRHFVLYNLISCGWMTWSINEGTLRRHNQ